MGSNLCFKGIPLCAVLRIDCREARAEGQGPVRGQDRNAGKGDFSSSLSDDSRATEKGLEVVAFWVEARHSVRKERQVVSQGGDLQGGVGGSGQLGTWLWPWGVYKQSV